ncbi:UNVERIFIED_CONTAM: hypothetical protein Sindi_2581100, partial [Sesamum indicum]
MQAINSAILDVNRDFNTQISYAWAHRRVWQLQDCFYTFQWVGNHLGVTWNYDERKLTADDQVWNAIARENLVARCYQNVYEPKWEELCELFDDDENIDIPVPDEEEEDDDDVLFSEIPNMAAPPPLNMTSLLPSFLIQSALIRCRAQTTKIARPMRRRRRNPL